MEMSSRSIKKDVIGTLFLLLIMQLSQPAAAGVLQLNDKDYFETRGFNVMVFENEFNGMFFDEKTAGILLVHHGNRIATGGSVRLKPTPEQWDQIPKVIDRKVDKENGRIEVLLRYEDFDFDSRLVVESQNKKIVFKVYLNEPLPEKLEGRAGFNLEFLPSLFWDKCYQIDGQIKQIPRSPAGEMELRPLESQLRQFSGHSTFDDRGLGEYVETKPIDSGNTIILAPEDSERRIEIASATGEIQLLDGRHVAQNGWYVLRTLIPSKRTGLLIEWTVKPHLISEWTREPMIAHSQVGYIPEQPKKAIIELDNNDTPLNEASLLRLTENGGWSVVYKDKPAKWGNFLRFNYLTFDFSDVTLSGLYRIQYGDKLSEPFPIASDVYDRIWQPTLDVWFPVQMDHMFVNEAYRVWHGAAHLDDARQAPVNHQHFDGFRQGDSTDTQFKPGEHIPGLNIGGWFDAGDYDIRTNSHCQTVQHLVATWEEFQVERDQTLVDQKARYVEIHHPDGKADLLQQIEQGSLALIAQHRVFGRAIQDIIVPNLHQYHHLGDGSVMTDNLIYNAEFGPDERDGTYSGIPDDRWAFTSRDARTNYASIAALAAASRALRGYDESLAEECLDAAEHAWKDEHNQPEPENQRAAMFLTISERSAALQLYAATKEQQYRDRFEELLWPGMDRGLAWNMGTASEALSHMDVEFRNKLKPYVKKYKESNDRMLEQNPFGVFLRQGGWAGNTGIVRWASTNYLLHKAYPDVIGPEYTWRGLDYIFGCHPVHNVSFVSGIGRQSKTKAYGSNRADFSFIPGGIVPGVLIIKPDLPENLIDWPFLWGENEYVIDASAAYLFLAKAAGELSRPKAK